MHSYAFNALNYLLLFGNAEKDSASPEKLGKINLRESKNFLRALFKNKILALFSFI